jgi:excisionase family DNA binding protein
MEDGADLLLVKEAAARLRVTASTVHRLIASGTLKAVKVGKGVRISRASLDALLAPVSPDLMDEGPEDDCPYCNDGEEEDGNDSSD